MSILSSCTLLTAFHRRTEQDKHRHETQSLLHGLVTRGTAILRLSAACSFNAMSHDDRRCTDQRLKGFTKCFFKLTALLLLHLFPQTSLACEVLYFKTWDRYTTVCSVVRASPWDVHLEEGLELRSCSSDYESYGSLGPVRRQAVRKGGKL